MRSNKLKKSDPEQINLIDDETIPQRAREISESQSEYLSKEVKLHTYKYAGSTLKSTVCQIKHINLNQSTIKEIVFKAISCLFLTLSSLWFG